jgi:AcrR family transcriptional regulator
MSESGIPRPRNSTASRQALLDAAGQLFSARGYDRTTLRDIGELAGIDPALIARYFGNKAALYIAAVAADRGLRDDEGDFSNLEPFVRWLIERIDRSGPGPILQALVRSDTAEEIRAAASDRLYRRAVQPMEDYLRSENIDRPRLRAELAVAGLIGIVLGRSLGSFRALHDAQPDELVELAVALLSPDLHDSAIAGR